MEEVYILYRLGYIVEAVLYFHLKLYERKINDLGPDITAIALLCLHEPRMPHVLNQYMFLMMLLTWIEADQNRMLPLSFARVEELSSSLTVDEGISSHRGS